MTLSYEPGSGAEVRLEREGAVATLLVDRPKARNAMGIAVCEAVDALIDEVEADPTIRALVVTGTGEKSFIAGADINDLIAYDTATAWRHIEVGHRLFTRIENLPSATIASVIYNRLNIGMPLQLDSTVVYAIRETGETTMSTELIQATDSPYNTYLYQGLPPGPICNPGMKSIEAALNPEQTGYYYFALDMETKSMRFFATLAEHEAFVATQDYG